MTSLVTQEMFDKNIKYAKTPVQSSPIQTLTVGPGFSPGPPHQWFTDLERFNVHHRRSGITPCPEDQIDILLLN